MAEDKSSSMENKADNRSDQLSHQFIKQITNDFDEALIVGADELGTVYKGICEDGEEIAMKVLTNMSGFESNKFQKEFENLRRLEHQNIVKLVGFCSESEKVVAEYKGKEVIAQELHMALCYEYVHNDSLAKHISADGCSGLSWHTQYKIIKGICQGLEYLQHGLEFSVWHLNLRPDNILLDKNMIPKIAYYGLSRFLGDENTGKIPGPFRRSCYAPIEYTQGGVFTNEQDIFSLGFIITNLMAGHEGFFKAYEMRPKRFIEHVRESWRKRLCETMAPKAATVYCKQVKICIQIAVKCMMPDRQVRPTIQSIVSKLTETERMVGNRRLHTEKFNDGESILPKGGIQATAPEPSCSFLSPSRSGELLHLHKSSWSSFLVPQESIINKCSNFSCEISTARMSEENRISSMGEKVDHRSDQPYELSHQFIKQITKDYNEGLIIGSGAFGTVYKGICENGEEIAVKALRNMSGIDNKEFQKEFKNLRRLKHQNVVELVGFCNEAEKVLVEHNGNNVVADKMHTALCFEYVCNGSLAKHISADGCSGLNWHIQYKIIKGICQGLEYLRHGLEFFVWHLDLKPANILLDSNMIPKIADFGLSRLLGDENTRKTISSVGTRGYLPPEYIERGLITREYDIFSLGVIIAKLMAGREGYFKIDDMGEKKFIKHVHENWRKRLRETLAPRPLEVYCEQVKVCIQIAVKCMNRKREERPTIQFIVSNLIETETMIGNLGLQIEQFHNGETDFPKGGIHARTPEMAPDASKGKTGDDKAGTESTKLKVLPLELLRKITNDFSHERIIGTSSFGTLYKGILEDGEAIMVKKLGEDAPVAHERVFFSEVQSLTALKHENATHFVGFCREMYKKVLLSGERYIAADVVESLLCYEYLPKGTLRKYLLEEPSETLDWEIRFKIIKGICQGLLFLHSIPIVHMDIKPDSILLDNDMRPKFSDFGLSRFFGQEETQKKTKNIVGTYGYFAPEYIYRGEISTKSDIYSLGIVILETSIKERIVFEEKQMSSRKFILNVRKNWTKERIALEYPSLDAHCLKQIKACIKIGLECVKIDRHVRPSIKEIVDMLDKLSQIRSNSLLSLQTQRINFPIKPKRLTSSSLYLINRTDDRIAFRLVTKIPKMYRTKLPFCGTVLPKCTYTLNVITPEQKRVQASDRDDSLTLQSSIASHEDLDNVDPASVAVFLDTVVGYEVREAKVVVACEPLAQTISNQIIDGQNYREVLSIDVHPTKPWILSSNQRGYVCIWNYQMKEEVDSTEVTREPAYSAKFIERQEWFVVGSGDGYICVYNYNTMEEVVDMIEAHDSHSIMCLAVSPTHPFVLSSSDDHTIKLWDWTNEWQCIKTFEGHNDTVTQVMFDPRNSERFSSSSLDHTIKIWNVHSATCNITWDGHSEGLLCVHYHPRYFQQFLISGSLDGAAKIWDLETDSCVDTLEGHAKGISALCWHPELRVLVTGSQDGTVQIWKSTSTTYKLENNITLNLGAVNSLGYLKGLTRIVVGCDQGIAVMEINVL